KDVNIDMLADKTEGYSGADIEAICTEAGLNALREDMETKEVTAKNFSDALEKLKPSLTEEILEYYKNIDMKKVATAPPIQYIG
ncbi:MAG: ATPase, partial [Candidatus Aenigmarchaeota archaeon]|nr:ATPase [Candidatus Aenigmarchaeota archaeon]